MEENNVAKQRKTWFFYDRKSFLFLLEVLAVICFCGCGAAHSDRKREVSVQSLYSSNPAVGRNDTASLKLGIQKITPDIPYEEQLDIILRNKEKWCYVPTEEDFWLSISDYRYRISDMDQNGLLEIISSATSGNGSVFLNTYYEVSMDGKSLVKLATDDAAGEDSAPDWWYSDGLSQGYYDRTTKLFHYPQGDYTHGGAVDTSDAELDVVFRDGKVAIDTISYIQSRSHGEMDSENFRAVTKFYAGAKEKKLGEIITPYQEEQGGFIDDPEQEKKYFRQIADLYERYYQGMQEFVVTDQWFSVVNETEEGVAENKTVSEKELRKRAQDSWNSFVIYVLDENEIENPFFPKKAAADSEVKFLVDLMSLGKATMQTEMELRGNGGALYRVTFSEPRELTNRETELSKNEEGASEASDKEFLEERMDEIYFYLWVTEKQIYYIPRFYDFSESDGGRYFGEETFDEEAEVDWQQKIRLVFYNELPQNAYLVCQEEEKKDSLKEMAKGDHQWIEKHGEDIRCYRAYTSQGEGYDTADILQLVWKRGEGLIGVRSAAHPAGGHSELFWAEPYLEVKEGGFSID